MQAFTHIEAVGIPMPAADIDTDQIVPARFMHKRRVDYGRYCFYDLRFDAVSETPRPDFIMNQESYRGARIIVAGPNFGCGSSREQAVHTLQDFGIVALLGASFGDIFFNNCLKNGLLPVRLSAGFAATLLAELQATPGASVAVDLPSQRVTAPSGSVEEFSIDEFNKSALLSGTDEIDYTLGLNDFIDRYEARCDINRPPVPGAACPPSGDAVRRK